MGDLFGTDFGDTYIRTIFVGFDSLFSYPNSLPSHKPIKAKGPNLTHVKVILKNWVIKFVVPLLPLNPIKVFLNLQLLPPPDADNEIIIIAMCQVDYVVYTCTHEDYLLPSLKPCDSVTQRNVGRRREEMLRRARGVNDLYHTMPTINP